MKVLLAGATGLVGGHVLKQLLDDPRCTQLVAVTRRPLPQTAAKLINPVMDFNALPTDAPWWQVDAAICALGTTLGQAGSREAFRIVDLHYPLTIARAVKANGCGNFVLNSAMGANPTSPIFYNRTKGELEAQLRALGFASLSVVRPGLIGGQRSTRRTGEHLASMALTALAPMLPRRLRINPAERIAHVMVANALQPVPGETVIGSEQLL